jgi:hypothetical protein
MSISYTNFPDFRLPATSKSDDTSDEENRRREMRRKQQSTAIKIQNQSRIASKNLLDEVLGKEFVQKNSNSLVNQPDIGRNQGLTVPAQLKGRDVQNDLDDQKKLADVEDHLNLEGSRDIIKNRDRSETDGIANFSTSIENSEASEESEMTQQTKEFDSINAEIDQQAPENNKKFSPSPLSMLNTQLDKLKNQIFLIDEKRLQNQTNPHDLEGLAEQQTRMATSLDFLEGYADGVVKDEADRQQFEKSCNDLREQLLQSEHNFTLALSNIIVNQPTQLMIHTQSQSQKIHENNDKMTDSDKRELDERTRLLADSSEIQTEEEKQKSSYLDYANRTQRVRAAKRDRDNAESTLPLLVQRSV